MCHFFSYCLHLHILYANIFLNNITFFKINKVNNCRNYVLSSKIPKALPMKEKWLYPLNVNEI